MLRRRSLISKIMKSRNMAVSPDARLGRCELLGAIVVEGEEIDVLERGIHWAEAVAWSRFSVNADLVRATQQLGGNHLELRGDCGKLFVGMHQGARSEEHTSELQSL